MFVRERVQKTRVDRANRLTSIYSMRLLQLAPKRGPLSVSLFIHVCMCVCYFVLASTALTS